MVRRYQARIPGPIRDRFDLEITLPPVELKELARSGAADPGDASREARARVELARARQRERWRGLPYALNAWAPSEELFRRGEIDPPALELATRCASRRRLSARGFHRLLRVARTVADLEGSGAVREAHVAEAAGFRSEIETVEQ